MRGGSISSRLTTPFPERTNGSGLQVGQGVTCIVASAAPRCAGVKSTRTVNDCSASSVIVPSCDGWNAAPSVPPGASMRTSVRA